MSERKFKIGDIFLRNNKPLPHAYDTDPQKIIIIRYGDVKLGDSCNGYVVKDLTTRKLEKDTYTEEFLIAMYDDIRFRRKQKLEKIKDYTSQNQ